MATRTVEGILYDGQDPDPDAYKAGWDAHAGGKGFHEGPYRHDTMEALSWRMGWNDRALKENG